MRDPTRRPSGPGLRKLALCLGVAIFAVGSAKAHGGGLDACGGHHDRKNGGYHVHNWTLYRACHPTPEPSTSRSALTPEASPLQGTPEESKRVVWVTARGTKYHREDCRTLTATRRTILLAEAKVRFTPCSVCRPETRDRSAPPGASTPAASPGASPSRCAATTQKGTRCSRASREGSAYCWQHAR